jgi:hypothetical protein
MTTLTAQMRPGELRPVMTALVGVVLATLPPVVVLVFGDGTPALAAVLVFAVGGSGPGVVCWVDAGDGIAQTSLIVAASLTAFATASTALIWLHAWTPELLWILAVASLLSCLARLVRFDRQVRP